MKKITIITFIILIIVSITIYAEDYKVKNFTSDNILFEITNFEFTKYENKDAISIDVKATAETSFLGRDLELDDFYLLLFDKDVKNEIKIKVDKFNSYNYGTILSISKIGEIIEEKKDISEYDNYSGVKIESGKTHEGSLLFLIPESYSMIHAFEYKSEQGKIRQSPNKYIDLTKDNLKYDATIKELSKTKVATESHMNLLNVARAMEGFFKLNNNLKSAW